MPEEVVIIFTSTHDVIKAKSELEKASITYELIPTPKEISSECGMSLRIEKPVLNMALEIFRSNGVRYRNDLL
ncbi:MAG: hypothetical protein A4E55_00918 [Pelotomaculum sp. PtaU1.Bin035]|nr:MAG: hypothetical protein A4E55_00918 [Pelotomaculum sp. PtaU1.Bin035]